MRYTGPKDRLSRREGVDLFGKGVGFRRLSVPPGMHGPKGLGKISLVGRQLREKQKAKRIYGVSEKQFRGYVSQAAKSRGNTGERLMGFLERRLDNVVFRLGFAPGRPSARQIVSHNHVKVDGKTVNVPSYLVSKGEVINLDSKAIEIPEVVKVMSEERGVPGWLERKAAAGRVLDLPKREDVPEPISGQDIVEFYSR